jgi:hypothetical protein
MGVLTSYTANSAIGIVSSVDGGYSSGDSSSSDPYSVYDCSPYDYTCYRKRSLHSFKKRDLGYALDLGLLGGAAGLSALELYVFSSIAITPQISKEDPKLTFWPSTASSSASLSSLSACSCTATASPVHPTAPMIPTTRTTPLPHPRKISFVLLFKRQTTAIHYKNSHTNGNRNHDKPEYWDTERKLGSTLGLRCMI